MTGISYVRYPFPAPWPLDFPMVVLCNELSRQLVLLLTPAFLPFIRSLSRILL